MIIKSPTNFAIPLIFVVVDIILLKYKLLILVWLPLKALL